MNSGPPRGVVEEPAASENRRDADDIARFLGGETAGFEALARRYQRRAYAVALGLCGSHDDAMDATQKAMLRAMHALPRFRAGEPFFPWLYRIVRNCALNQRRDQRRHLGQTPLEWVDATDARPSPLEEAAGAELKGRLWAAVTALPLEQRETFLLYTFQGLKYREIAETLGVPIGTVMSRLHGARRQLRRALAEEGTAL